MSGPSPRVAFWGKNVASHYSTLTRRFTELGVEAVRFGPTTGERRYRGLPDTPIRRALDVVVRVTDKATAMVDGGGLVPGPVRSLLAAVPRAIGVAARRLECWLDAAHLATRFDVLVFGFGKTPTDTELELRLYRLLRRRLVFVFHGSDARPPYLDAVRVPPDEEPDWDKLRAATQRMQRRLARVERRADVILAYPAITHFLTREITDWYHLEKPLSLPTLTTPGRPPARPDARRTLRVGHAPSHRGGKGTPQLVAAIESLRAGGLDVELVMPDGFAPKEDVLAMLSTCDLTVDQVWADVPGATLAAELAALGWKVLVGASERDFLTARYPERCRVIRLFDPWDLEAVLHAELSDRSSSHAAGARFGSAPLEVAQRHLDAILGSPRPGARFEPRQMPGVFGFGPENHLRSVTSEYVRRFGAEALELDHKPWLRDRIVAWCASTPAAPAHGADVGEGPA